MKATTSSCLGLILLWQGCLAVTQAQESVVAAVSQVLPFAASGTVTSGSVGIPTGEMPISSSPGSVAVPSPQTSIALAGGKITTGADGAASLVLGAGAEVGTARLGSDSEVKVPDAGEKGHSLEMLKGQLFLNISADQLKKRGNSEFKLKTPAALLAVKGTKFFSRSLNGKDTIGVHEGSVEVVEPSTGQKLTLLAGQAVDVSPGLLEAMREMTEEEKQFVPEYDKAMISRMSCGIYAEGQNLYYYQGAKVNPKDLPARMVLFNGVLIPDKNGHLDLRRDHRPWLCWKEASVQSSAGHLFAPKPQITDQGSIRYVWRPRELAATNKAETALMACWSSVGSEVSGNEEIRRVWERLVAVEFQLRALRVDSITLNVSLSDSSYSGQRLRGEQISGAQLPSNGDWIPVTVALRPGSLSNLRYLYPSIALKVFPKLADKLSQDMTAVEMRDFVLLYRP